MNLKDLPPSATVMSHSPTLDEIRAKVEAGERLSAAEGEFLFSPEVDLHDVGELADIGPPPQERQRGLLQPQPPPESDQRLHLPLRAVRLQLRRRAIPGLT